MKAVDWLARTAMLVLSALATLALIGSLASVSNSPIGAAFPGMTETSEPPPVLIISPTAETPVIRAPDGALHDNPSGQQVFAQPDGRIAYSSIVRWLKALTYAVLALAVFAAAGVVALVRIATHLRRIAER